MITSMSNAQVKELQALLQKAKARREKDAYVVEGIKMCTEAPAPFVERIFISESLYGNDTVNALLDKAPFEVLQDDIFLKVSDTKTPQGIMCIVKRKHYNRESLLNKKNPFIIVLEDIQDPGNMGTILRTAEGAGVSGIMMSKNTVDIYNPKTIRSTMGSIFRMSVVSEENLADGIMYLQSNSIKVYAAHLKGDKYYDEFSYNQGTAFLIGNEGNGLKKETADLADTYLKIPMEGQVESLNAAVSASVLMYEVVRQRRRH